jgi:transcriptional regulator with XRE-family HTH domain
VSQLAQEVRRARRLPPPPLARAIRVAADVSQERMAGALGVHRVTLARWETGRRRPRGELLDAYVALLDELRQEAQ